ncbi:hypothetical protein KKP91_03985 [Methanothermococcus sp. SCGC AD-155-M21]|nr:hypothetical protein [Methanothermococcus sp. SCGC AD-155-M21]
MFGRHGFFRGQGRCHFTSRVNTIYRRGSYKYIGPCRCGLGPHAYYLDEFDKDFEGDRKEYLKEKIKCPEEEKKD